MKHVTTFGEIMLRISPEMKGERLKQANLFRIEPGGSESNVSIALSNLGIQTKLITRLPKNSLSEKVLEYLNQFKVDTSEIIFGGSKLGTYWTENGIGPRNSFVIYDRNLTAFSEVRLDDFNWKDILKDSEWFHFSGISPALCENIYNVLYELISYIEIPYSVDLNYRAKLWDWLEKDPILINAKMENLCDKATLIAGNETDFQNVLGISPDLEKNEDIYDQIATTCFSRFPNLRYISISIRESLSASSNIWGINFYVKDNTQYKYNSITFNLESIEDRVGTGDSFVAGIIYGILKKPNYSFQEIADFASALSALNHTTRGDASRFSVDDVNNVMKSNGNGRIIR